MENAHAQSTSEVLKFFSVSETHGLTEAQVQAYREKYGRNGEQYSLRQKSNAKANTRTAIAEDPPTPLWELILEQFKDQLVIILLGSAAVSFVLALFEEDGGWTAFVDPAVVSYVRDAKCDQFLTRNRFSRS
jgi:P-type Ca2+ transporter type 2A